MSHRPHVWAVVLAAGDGTRLSRLTTDANGNAIPKQFCSLTGGPSLLDEALQRAREIAPRERTCAVVADQHRAHWRRQLWALPAGNTIVQPRNRGTAHGVLLSVLSVLERDPLARILFLPADHYVRNERGLARSLRAAITLLTRDPRALALIGIEPEEPDPELGYILPGRRLPDGLQPVETFIEKPEPDLARALLARGALWNSFIFAASGAALLGLLRARLGSVVDEMTTALSLQRRAPGYSKALVELYGRLPATDFSRSVLQGAEHSLRVIAAPACGWSDLGTPARVAATLRRLEEDRLQQSMEPVASRSFATPALINLAAQQDEDIAMAGAHALESGHAQ